jgi:peptidoglycan/LPS O-acetylase OafA/YrhL
VRVAAETFVTEADERVQLGASGVAAPLSHRRPVGRILELDAVRGLAAVTVVIGHSLIVFPNVERNTRGASHLGLLNGFKYSPLTIVSSGDAAVVLFFILSGFVLTLPFLGSRAPSYPAFLVKRVCRIFLPYLAAVALAITCAALLGDERLPGLSDWANAPWQDGFGVGLLTGHATLVGSFDNAQYDPALWSLVYEMRISLIFPLLVFAIVALGLRRGIVAALALVVAGIGLNAAGDGLGHPSDYFKTLYYVPCFVAGILFARERRAVMAWFSGLGAGGRALLLVAGVALYTHRSWVDPTWLPGAGHDVTDALAVTLGGCGLLVWALGSHRVAQFLRGRIPQFLGRISYSLYLTHAVILLALLHLLHDRIPMSAIIALMWLIAVPVAALSYRWVELPAIGLGKRVAAMLDARRVSAAWDLDGEGGIRTLGRG